VAQKFKDDQEQRLYKTSLEQFRPSHRQSGCRGGHKKLAKDSN